MTLETKERIVARITELKKIKPEGWQKELRQIVYRLSHAEYFEFREHEDHGSEERGRKRAATQQWKAPY